MPRPLTGGSVIRLRLSFVAAVAALTIAPPSTAGGYPPAVPKKWHAPAWWMAQAACIRAHEGWPTAATGNGYEGSYQFLRSTWESVGGPVDRRTGHWASVVSPREQLYRAWLLWTRDGQSWREWGTAGRCGLR